MKRVFGGWQINAIATFQSGPALAFLGADRVSDTNADPRTIDQWFDKTQFAPQLAFTLKTLSSRVADIRGPDINKVDTTLMKRIAITERVAMQIHNASTTRTSTSRIPA
jgi:hypothetical protein